MSDLPPKFSGGNQLRITFDWSTKLTVKFKGAEGGSGEVHDTLKQAKLRDRDDKLTGAHHVFRITRRSEVALVAIALCQAIVRTMGVFRAQKAWIVTHFRLVGARLANCKSLSIACV